MSVAVIDQVIHINWDFSLIKSKCSFDEELLDFVIVMLGFHCNIDKHNERL